jgi:hypothetical protein
MNKAERHDKQLYDEYQKAIGMYGLTAEKAKDFAEWAIKRNKDIRDKEYGLVNTIKYIIHGYKDINPTRIKNGGKPLTMKNMVSIFACMKIEAHDWQGIYK